MGTNLLDQPIYFTLVAMMVFILALVGMLLLYSYYKLKELDRRGQKNILDSSIFPGISKLLWSEGGPIIITISLLLFVGILALITMKNELWDIFKINLGVVFGIIIRWGELKIKEEKDPTKQLRKEKEKSDKKTIDFETGNKG